MDDASEIMCEINIILGLHISAILPTRKKCAITNNESKSKTRQREPKLLHGDQTRNRKKRDKKKTKLKEMQNPRTKNWEREVKKRKT